MDANLNIVCFICARGGSKGVKNKNILSLSGKPLIAWSIEAAHNANVFSEIVISTDSDDIADVGQKYGARTYFRRPDDLSSDSAGKWEVWQHALESYERLTRKKIDVFVDLDCTAPLREVSDIKNAIDLFLSKNVDVVFSICKAKKNPYFNMVEYMNGYLALSKSSSSKIIRRQDAPDVYEHAASIYVMSPDFIRMGTGLLSGKGIGYLMDSKKCIDIDEELDFEIVEHLMKKKIK